MIIKEDRPKNPLSYIDDDLIKGSQIYGMPSGHAQIISFAITFLILTNNSKYLIIPSIFIGILTLIQRWKYRRHSIEQLLAGSFVGSFFSYITFYFTEIYLQKKSNINIKIL
jgi:membrane-associated phospholipid phosphatase